MFHELQHHAVPLARERVLGAVLAVGHQVQNVIEADLARHPFQQVHAKAVEPGVASVVLFVMHHHVRVFLAPHTVIHIFKDSLIHLVLDFYASTINAFIKFHYL